MKKRIISILLTLSIITIPIFSQEKNKETVITKSFNLEAGYCGLLYPYLYQDINYQMFFNNVGFDVGAKFLENLTFTKPYVFISPYASFLYKKVYISLGVTFFNGWNNSMEEFKLIPYGKTGFRFSNIPLKIGTLSFNVGIECSITPVNLEDEENVLGAVFSSVFITIFNTIKPYIGVTWNIPF